jgi:hypothetical protein
MDRESPDDGLFESEKKEENECESKESLELLIHSLRALFPRRQRWRKGQQKGHAVQEEGQKG